MGFSVLTIDLAAIQANWLLISSMTSGVSAAGVIKANAYGLGAQQVGKALYDVGCREFFLATPDEALAARKFLPSDAVIYVLGGVRSTDEQIFIEENLIPVLCSLHSIEKWAEQNTRRSLSSPFVVKINTGMTRFGLDIGEFNSLCNNTALIKKINPVLFMSHLACADEPLHPLNTTQHKTFNQCAVRFKKILPTVRLSLANSSGILLGSSFHYDLVRPGAALYGINPQPNNQNPMRPVVRLALPIIQVRTLTEVSSLGYSATASLVEGARVAIVAGGYADGVHRTVGTQPEGILCGQRVKAIGRISMDVTIFDISNIQLPTEYLLSEAIEIINNDFSLDYLTKKNSLLGYEVLTSLGNRYTRNYLPGHSYE